MLTRNFLYITFFLFPDSRLYLLNDFDFYLFWIAWHWKLAIETFQFRNSWLVYAFRAFSTFQNGRRLFGTVVTRMDTLKCGTLKFVYIKYQPISVKSYQRFTKFNYGVTKQFMKARENEGTERDIQGVGRIYVDSTKVIFSFRRKRKSISPDVRIIPFTRWSGNWS